jgi:hypothetical protein
LLRQSGATRNQLLDWARKQPSEAEGERAQPQLIDNRFVWFPLEVTFGSSGAIERITVGGEAY